MNMEILKKSRKKPQPGDVFVLRITGDVKYYFGRVISLDAKIGGFDNVVLIYIYKKWSEHKEDIPTLDPKLLLVPPMGTNRLPWSRGYFETVGNIPLSRNDVLKIHCFYDFFHRCYWDDNENKLPSRIELCGSYGLQSFMTIDDAVSEALGIPLAPDE